MGDDTRNEEDPLLRQDEDESHKDSAGMVADAMLGAADGLTVPFALAAGLSGAFVNSRLVIVAVLAELAAGSISMGLGGFLSGRTEQAHYYAERRREEWEVKHKPRSEEQEVIDILQRYGLSKENCKPVLDRFKNDPTLWVDFMMKFELNIDKPDDSQPLKSALVIGGSYLIAGFVPLLPYLLFTNAITALKVSVLFTVIALFAFGFARSKLLRMPGGAVSSALETTVVGILAAGAAYLIARLVPT